MRISAKGRYALAAIVYMSERYETGEYITISNISEALSISKIYLEQIFSILKKDGLVTSIKGAQGGYLLTNTPNQITALDVLLATESALLEETESTVSQKDPAIESAMQSIVFSPLYDSIMMTLKNVTIQDLLKETEKKREDKNFMFFI